MSVSVYQKTRNKTPVLDGWLWFLRSNHLLESISIFKVSPHSNIIHFRFFELLNLDYVKINTTIKSVAYILSEKRKVIWKYVWSWFSSSTVVVSWHLLVVLRFLTSEMLKSATRMSLHHAYNSWWTRGHNKQVTVTLFYKVIFWVKVRYCNKWEIHGI